ncbi:Cell cycle checkpoint protein RAD1 homolog mrt-2 [Caenorhabditis elegans]|uniref:Cell cycle checkpoint protein RAD1 homolog mrt-2 n=1 Tax=Caenorhabditis elegans TaxID=6239 RepID=MRT2_CAEEL|nr:Cell cycle checkpoint protein RAD1 homolog mrt-2 [Caenorhabditis elegans]G5EC44.1 RecName: Full=Cell cycle checkpoint protein RAD1 homolog mrt-2 [Caenorhabditis elegans]AAC95525.1 Rad1-like protein [Caenorhabditis elegans]CAB63359.2 Cell cycle checkpoint protein RAD1 homolog mrt-2 [Caenorhabditis elegans]|eukprot:NP_499521.1 Cell cycle checkpoint protein RAD1 homolog mrt-2 [Caenorhabditis elegans]
MMELETGQCTIMELKKENVKELAQVFKTVAFKDTGTWHASEAGMKITVDDGSYQLASVFINPAFFSSFKVREEIVSMKISIKSISEFLSISENSSSSVKVSYPGMFQPVKMLVEDADGWVARGNFTTTLADQELDFEFDDAGVLATYLLKTQVLKEIIKDFDDTSRTVRIQFTKNSLCFTTFGDVGETTVSIPSRSLQMESVKCLEEVEFSYLLSLIQRMTTAFILATKLILRVDERGVLSCQFSIDHGEGNASYIEFLTVPADEEE